MCSALRPLHTLLFHKAVADHLIDRRFDKGGADRLTLTIPLAKVGVRAADAGEGIEGSPFLTFPSCC